MTLPEAPHEDSELARARSLLDAARASQRLYRDLVETANELIWSLDTQGRITYANCAAIAATGWDPPTMLGQRFSELGAAAAHDAFEMVLRGEPSAQFEIEIAHRDGSRAVLRGHTQALRDDRGALVGASASAIDITEARRAEQLQAATWRISEAAQAAPDLPALFRALHAIIGELMPARNFYIALFDSASQMITFPYYVDERHPPSRPRKMGGGLTEYVLRTGKILLSTPEVRAELIRRGEATPTAAPAVCWLGVPLRTTEKTIGVLATQSYTESIVFGERETNILQFVSTQAAMAIERRRSVDLLRESERKYRLLFEANPEPMWLFDQESLALLAVNSATVACYGHSEHELLTMTVADLRPPNEPQKLEELILRAPPGRMTFADLRHRRKDWSLFHVDVSAQRVELEGRRVCLVLAKEVSARRKLEAQLRQAQKMEAVGRLAGGVAHDFNNIVTAILGHCDLALDRLSPNDPVRPDLEEVRQSGMRAAALTRQLLAFSHSQMVQPAVVDVVALMLNLERMLRRLIGEHVELVTSRPPERCCVRADPGQLEQVIVNLAVNARDAMAGGGRLAIDLRAVELTADERAPLAAGRYVQICVSDTGIGIDEQTKAHLFEPFFTTKGRGEGTGLGLATVYGIVQQSGGHIWVDSEPDHGTTFRIYLPRVDEQAALAHARRPAAARRTGSETVLVVEDEAHLRALARRVLEAQGYTVLEASNGVEGYKLAVGHGAPIHLLLSDVVMPAMGGPALAEQLKPRWPDMKRIFMSGYTDTAIEALSGTEGGAAFLQKPFAPDDLLRKVREVLDGAAPAAGRAAL